MQSITFCGSSLRERREEEEEVEEYRSYGGQVPGDRDIIEETSTTLGVMHLFCFRSQIERDLTAEARNMYIMEWMELLKDGLRDK